MRWLLWKALLGLLIFDLFGLGHNFSRLCNFVRKCKVAEVRDLSDTTDRISEAVNLACVVYPKRVRCLQRSAVTTCLARMCGIRAAMVMGAQKLPFKAHAWTEIDGQAVNERTDVQKTYGVWQRC
jgi:hypothetical protein